MVLSFAAFGLQSCRQSQHKLSSTLDMGDDQISTQLTSGFYTNGGRHWRWTARRFTAALLPPPGSEVKGAKLSVKLYFPDSEIQKIGPITLTPSLGDVHLASQTFSAGGSYQYEADVSAFFIRPNRVVPIFFELDRALSPLQTDGRELGVVVSEISLRSAL